MKSVPVEVTAITVCPPYQGFVLILREMEGPRWLPVFIGQIEAQNINHIQKGSRAIRRFTFDLIFGLLDAAGARVEEVVVTDLRDQTFYAEVILRLISGGVRQVDARPSDAIALALRTRAPIYVNEKVMSDAAQSEELGLSAAEPSNRLEELIQMLQKAVDDEEYETAAKLRDKIKELEAQASPVKQ